MDARRRRPPPSSFGRCIALFCTAGAVYVVVAAVVSYTTGTAAGKAAGFVQASPSFAFACARGLTTVGRGRRRDRRGQFVEPLKSVASLRGSPRVVSLLRRAGNDVSAANVTDSASSLQIAIMVPGLLYGSSFYDQLVQDMKAAGYPMVAVPMEWWHWLPCLGGRSMRPVLERIDYTVDYVLKSGTADPVPAPSYSIFDLLSDFLSNPGGVLKVGGSSDPDEYPKDASPYGADFTEEARHARSKDIPRARIALIGHSAGGWISRLFLSSRDYGGRAYEGATRVHSLVSLGSPHAVGPSAAYSSLKWLYKDSDAAAEVRSLAVAGTGFVQGSSSDFTKDAYVFCGGAEDDETMDGDGITPLFSAHAFEEAEKLTLEGTTHAPEYPDFGPFAELATRRKDGQPWYGDQPGLEKWLQWLKAGH